ncbi:hypothetical protein K8Q96_02385 [Candidatus Nomurabacteria bacterium]|nr:hypothetical protein [Candidatus Nomurabacteria bacterium]
MRTETFNQNPMSDSARAMMEIQAIEQQMQQGGNVDGEKDQFNQIIKDLSLNNITPEKALTEIQNIMSHRQDYH